MGLKNQMDETSNSRRHRFTKLSTGNNKHRSSRRISMALCMFAVMGLLTSCSSTKKEIETIQLTSNQITMDVNETAEVTVTTTPEDASQDSIEIKSADELTTELKDGKLSIQSSAKEGDYEISLSSEKATEQKISIKVEDKEKKALEEKAKLEAETKAKEEAEAKAKEEAEAKAKEEAAAQQKAEEQARIDAENAAQQAAQQQQQQQEAKNEYTSQAPATPQAPQAAQVYIAGSGNGTKYHSNPNCSNMKSTIQLSIDEAINRGYGACSKCH